MAAYIINSVVVRDPEGYSGYSKLARPAIEKYGGRAVIRSTDVEVKEGDWHPQRLVVLEFDTLEQAKNFYDSPEYREARAIREKYASANFWIVEGV